MLDQLYRRHHADALRILAAKIGHHQAEDALQTAWLILARRLERRPDYVRPVTVRAWLILVALREHGHEQRRRGDAVSLEREIHPDQDNPRTVGDMQPHPTAEASIHAHLELAEILDALEQLHPGQRRAQVCAMLGLTYKQEQHACDVTYTNVNRHRTEGRAALRAQLT